MQRELRKTDHNDVREKLNPESPVTSATKSTKVIVVDDHPLIRAGLRAMLAGSSIEIVAEASSASEAIAAIQSVHAEVVLMDVRLGQDDGIKTTQIIKNISPELAVLMLSSFESDDYLRAAIRVGASGYLLKGASRSTLEDVIRRIGSGESLFDEMALLRIVRSRQDESMVGVTLNAREQQILQLICSGCTNTEISDHLVLSQGTIKKNIQSLFSKLGVQNRTEAAMAGVRLGIELSTNSECSTRS